MRGVRGGSKLVGRAVFNRHRRRRQVWARYWAIRLELGLAVVDAALEVGTYRLIAIFGSLYVTGIGGINARRCLAGAALMAGSTLILLCAATANS